MKNSLETQIRIGCINYINMIPFFHKLFNQPASFLQAADNYPTKINLAMRKGNIDIAPISSLAYLQNQQKYCVLPGLSIGARDFSGSVILFSNKKIENLDGEVIALTRESLSSAVLLRILLCFKYKFKNRFVASSAEPQEMLQKHTAALLIGDKALLYQSKEFVYKYDLSELWWNWTGKPFCFSVWAVQKKCMRESPAEVALFYQRLRSNLEHNLADLEALIKESLGMNFLNADFSKVFGYLFNLQYGFDQELQEGLQLFFRLAHRLGFSPRPGKIEFCSFPQERN